MGTHVNGSGTMDMTFAMGQLKLSIWAIGCTWQIDSTMTHGIMGFCEIMSIAFMFYFLFRLVIKYVFSTVFGAWLKSHTASLVNLRMMRFSYWRYVFNIFLLLGYPWLPNFPNILVLLNVTSHFIASGATLTSYIIMIPVCERERDGYWLLLWPLVWVVKFCPSFPLWKYRYDAYFNSVHRFQAWVVYSCASIFGDILIWSGSDRFRLTLILKVKTLAVRIFIIFQRRIIYDNFIIILVFVINVILLQV